MEVIEKEKDINLYDKMFRCDFNEDECYVGIHRYEYETEHAYFIRLYKFYKSRVIIYDVIKTILINNKIDVTEERLEKFLLALFNGYINSQYTHQIIKRLKYLNVHSDFDLYFINLIQKKYREIIDENQKNFDYSVPKMIMEQKNKIKMSYKDHIKRI